MFRRRPATDEAIERAFALASELQRGDLLSHETLESAFGVTRQDERYYALAGKLKRRMEADRGISLDNVPLAGYALCTPKEQLGIGRRRVVQARRRLDAGLRSVQALPDDECDFTCQRAKLAMEEKLIQATREMRQESQRMAFLMRPRDTGPRVVRDDAGDASEAV